MTVVRKCGSNQGGVKCIRKVCQLIERCDGHGGVVRKCDIHQRGVKGIRKVC